MKATALMLSTRRVSIMYTKAEAASVSTACAVKGNWSHLQFILLCMYLGQLFHFVLQAGDCLLELISLGFLSFPIPEERSHS